MYTHTKSDLHFTLRMVLMFLTQMSSAPPLTIRGVVWDGVKPSKHARVHDNSHTRRNYTMDTLTAIILGVQSYHSISKLEHSLH